MVCHRAEAYLGPYDMSVVAKRRLTFFVKKNFIIDVRQGPKAKKIVLLFPEMRVTKKIFP